MDIAFYRRYLNEYIREALQNSNGTNAGISEYLWEKQVGGWLIAHKTEKQRALADARLAFDEHRHWPVEIVLSHLGVEVKEPGKEK
ncbi:MAG TPA: hypothetical protein VJ436_12645 [Anaerolineales bacterium]|nr:hypothetical protein [Anaerolineales bacterium]